MEKNGWPGLGTEVKFICDQIQIQHINKYEVSKQEIQDAIFEAHHSSLLCQFETSKKLKAIKMKFLGRCKSILMKKSSKCQIKIQNLLKNG